MSWEYRFLARQYCVSSMTFEFWSSGNPVKVSRQIIGPLSLTSLNEKWRRVSCGRWAWKEPR